MIPITRQITEEQFDRAMANKGYIDDADQDAVFTASELYGYGVYAQRVFRNGNGQPCVSFMRGESCD